MVKINDDTATTEEQRRLVGIAERAKYIGRARPFRTPEGVIARRDDGLLVESASRAPAVADVAAEQRSPAPMQRQELPRGAHRVNLNTASMYEMQLIDGIDLVRARKIVAYREANGSFAGWDDVASVEGLDGRVLSVMRRCADL